MSFAAWIDHFDDWINPIVVKEVRQAVKSRLVLVILMLFLTLMLLVMSFSLFFQEAGDSLGANWSIGGQVFAALQIILLPTLALVVPAYGAIRMGNERGDSNNTDLLFISTLSPGSIISGKFWASLILAVLIFSIFAPFMTFTYLLRGIDMPTIGLILLIDVLMMVTSTMAALFLASIPGPRALKVFVMFGGFLGLFGIYILLAMGTSEMIQNPSYIFEERVNIWVVMAAISVTVLSFTALLYYYAVALISSPSSNRILPIRLCVLAFWLISGTAMFLWSWLMNWPMASMRLLPIGLWIIFNMIVLGVQMLISVCERDSWGPRMARAIPKNGLMRVVALFLYTGSGGGVLFTLSLMVLTLLLGKIWLDTEPDVNGPGYRSMFAVLQTMTVLALYICNYSLSAALIRYYFLSDHIRSVYTWVVGLLLAGLGSFVPAVFAYFVAHEQMRSAEPGWWMVANPLMAYLELTSYHGGHQNYLFLVVWFQATWFVLVVALAGFWIAAQITRFRPYQQHVQTPKTDELPVIEPLPRIEPSSTAMTSAEPAP